MAHIGHWIIDYLHMARGGVSMFVHSKPPKHYLGYTLPDKCPVILIPGIFGKWAFLKHLGDKISLSGHPVYVALELGYNIKDIPTSASIVRKIIDTNNIKNCVVVAHSKGGLIGKYLLTYLNSDNRIKGMVSIATPYSGSAIVKLLPPIKWLRDFTTTSEMLRELASHKEVNSKIVSISPEFDNHVWTKEGSYLEGAENIKVNEKGHHKIVYNPEVEKIILSSLKKFSKN